MRLVATFIVHFGQIRQELVAAHEKAVAALKKELSVLQSKEESAIKDSIQSIKDKSGLASDS